MSGAQTTQIDPRILKLVVSVGTIQYTFEDKGDIATPGLWMSAKGSKYANQIQNECTIEISNLATNDKNFILTETSPFNQNAENKSFSVYAGRVSTGYALVYSGDIVIGKSSQVPDVTLSLKSLTGNAQKKIVKGRTGSIKSKMSEISKAVADDLGLQLNFQAADKTIGNYAFSGSQLREVDKLGAMGNVNAYVDDGQLVVKNWNSPLSNTAVLVSEYDGMIGVPELTEEGVQVTFLFNNIAQLGGELELMSTSNPSLNGNYTIVKLSFDLTNRDTFFYYTAVCLNNAIAAWIDTFQGTPQTGTGGNPL